MLTLYTVLLTLHILLVICWLGAGITLQMLATQVARAGEEAERQYAAYLDWFGQRWFPIVSGLTGLVGVLLWIDGPWELGTAWLWIAVGGWIISSIIGATQLGPRATRMREAPGAAARSDFLRVARIDSVLLVLIVADMVIKPFS
jgi:uncharacterized membrane protein